MQKRAPTLGNILVIAMFVLSCFGLLLFLWESFGGPVPLKSKGYRFTIAFPQALQLAEQADVRISGVPVGHVVSFKLGKDGRTEALIEMDHQYAPVRADMHALLRTKTLLGETYVQLNPEGKTGPFIKDNGRLPNGQVEPTVTLDQILSLFNPKVRNDFKIWQQASAASFEGHGEDINADFASLQPFVASSNKLVTILASQEGALRGVVHNTGVVFNALAGRDHDLEGLISNGERTFKAAASASQEFAATWRAFPAFESKGRVALKELDKFAADASPLLDQSRAWERQLGPLSQQLKSFSPPFEKFLVGLGAFTKASKQGLPAFSKSLKLLEPELANLPPVLHNLNPFLQYLTVYQPELESFFGNFTAATEGHDKNTNDQTAPALHYLRTMQVFGPQSLAVFHTPPGTTRANAYPLPGAFNSLGSGLSVFSNTHCANSSPAANGPGNETVTQAIIEQLISYHIASLPEKPTGIFEGEAGTKQREAIEKEQSEHGGNLVGAPACNQQAPQTFNGQSSQFPHVTPSK
jgi:phospholipid/cholesterol/gamma-HCH transport system substrate-binding protein